MRFRTPANMFLHRAQLTLMLATLVPTVLMIAVGIVLLAMGSGRAVAIVSGVLVLAFCTTSLTGYILGSLFVRRGAALARVQHDFLSLVSHELRTPLTSIGLFIESLRDERLTDKEQRQECLDLLKQEFSRLEGMVEKLIHLSKLEAGQSPFEREPVEIATCVSEAVDALKIASMTDNPNVEIDVSADLTVLGDRTTLGQAISNLLINAWKYSGIQNRPIRIEAYSSDKHAIIEVSDQGPGIATRDQKRLFEKFERGTHGDHGPSGSGLGLAIVREIMRAHKGTVDVKSRPGHGATFRLRLPLHRG